MNRDRRQFWLWAGAALAAGLLLRLWFVTHLSRVAGDSLVYGELAKNLLLHRVYGFTEQGATPGSIMIRPTLIRLPGYPLFLAACFRAFGTEDYRAVMYVQVVADLATCWLASALSGRLFGSRAALYVLWLAALCPFTANYTALPLTETLVLTTIALTFYALARWLQAGAGNKPWLWVIGAALSYSILLRPDQGLLAVAVIPAMLWACLGRPESRPNNIRRANILRSAAPALCAVFCIVFSLAPWTIRNWRTFHVFEPLAPRYANDPGEQHLGGFNRWYRTWAIEFASTDEVYWEYDSNRIDIAYLPNRAFAAGCCAAPDTPRNSLPLYARTETLIDEYNQTAEATPANDAGFDRLGVERIHAAPICYYVVLPLARVANMMFRPRTDMMPTEDEWWKRPAPSGQTAFAAAYAALNLAYFMLAFAGLRAWHRRGWAGCGALAWAMVAALILRFALLLTIDNSEPRYTLEFFPVLFVWAGALFAKPARLPLLRLEEQWSKVDEVILPDDPGMNAGRLHVSDGHVL